MSPPRRYPKWGHIMGVVSSPLLRRASVLVAGVMTLFLSAWSVVGRGAAKAPEFPDQDPSHWVGTPARLADLRGKVVLLDVWTFG